MQGILSEFLDEVPIFLRHPDGEILHWSEGCEALYGFAAEAAVGRRAHDLLRTTFPEPVDAIEARLARDGKWSGRLRQCSSSGREIWTETVWRRRRGAEIVLEQNTDISDRVELEESNRLFARELEHRVKNILSVVQSLARMSVPDAPAEQQKRLDERIAALAEANRILQQGAWKEADLGAIATHVLGVLGVLDRIRIDGPELSVDSQDAVGLALVLHELGTNALKYGALSNRTGRVSLAWQAEPEEDGSIRLRWQEEGGPPVVPPARAGFGTKLIRRAISGDRPVEIAFAPEGLVCEFRVARPPQSAGADLSLHSA